MPSRRSTIIAWLLPPVLALAAVGVQFLVDVPHHAMLVDGDDPAPKKKTTTAARTPPPRKWKARGLEFSKRLRKQWSSKPIAGEPIDPKFAAHHEQLLQAIVRKAEAAAAPDSEPSAVTTVATCHTLRCEFEFCAPPELADKIAETLPRFRVGRRSLWYELREVESAATDDGRSCHGYIVDFAVEGSDPRNLTIGPTTQPH